MTAPIQPTGPRLMRDRIMIGSGGIRRTAFPDNGARVHRRRPRAAATGRPACPPSGTGSQLLVPRLHVNSPLLVN